MQIKNTHLLELQASIIDKLSLISSPKLKTQDDVELHPDVERWIEK
jgi:hypothetical protein